MTFSGTSRIETIYQLLLLLSIKPLKENEIAYKCGLSPEKFVNYRDFLSGENFLQYDKKNGVLSIVPKGEDFIKEYERLERTL